MKQTLLTIVFTTIFLTGCATATQTSTKAATWEPKKTWVLMVAVEVFKNNDTYADMPDPKREDQKLYDLFIKRGVPKEQIVYLKDKKATLKNIKTQFTQLLKKAKKGDTLFTYYTGHGTIDKNGLGYFANYDAPGNSNWTDWSDMWAVADMYKLIETHFKGDTVFTMGDCCFSGTLSSQMKTLKTDKAYASLSSSLSTLTAGMYWTFTESLISGFLGRSYLDSNNDNNISMQELAAHSRQDVAIFMNQETTFSTNENFPKKFNLGKSPHKTHKGVGKYYEVRIKAKQNSWQKAKAVKVNDGQITLLYYSNDDEAKFKSFKVDSKNLRTFSKQCFKMGDVVDVKDGRWYPAKIVAIDAKTGIHKIRYGNKKKWEGLFMYGDLRARR